MNAPRVTIVMPCYNSAKYVAQTIESVLSQTYTNYLFIAGNDGSTDNTVDILQRYANHITLINHPDHGNHGQAATYNHCLRFTDSEYIAFIDNDDLWHPEKLQKQVDILDQHPEAGLVYTNGNVIDCDGKILYPFLGSSHRETNEVGAILLDCYIRTPSTVMVRSSVLRTAGEFKEGIIPDHDMWVRMKELADFFYIDEKLFSYRVHNDQASQTSTEKMWREGFGTLSRAISRYPYPGHIRRKRLAVIHYRLGEFYARRNKMAAVYHFLLAFILNPFRALKVLKRMARS